MLPDYDENSYGYYGTSTHTGAPVEPDGSPVYYRVPEKLARASNDGERWRWALAQAAEADPSLLNTSRSTLAAFPARASSAPRPSSAMTCRLIRRTVARSVRPLRPRHPERRRDDRLAGFRNQAVQASRRIQSDQDLPGDRRRPQDGQGETSLSIARYDLRESPSVRSDRSIISSEPSRSYGDPEIDKKQTHRPDPRCLGPVRAAHDAARRRAERPSISASATASRSISRRTRSSSPSCSRT